MHESQRDMLSRRCRRNAFLNCRVLCLTVDSASLCAKAGAACFGSKNRLIMYKSGTCFTVRPLCLTMIAYLPRETTGAICTCDKLASNSHSSMFIFSDVGSADESSSGTGEAVAHRQDLATTGC